MNEKILLVDDEEENLQLLTRWLVPLDYDLDLAVNGEEAVRQVKESKPDLIILDIMMPRMDGYEACRILKENPETKDIPIIMVTAHHERKSKIEGLSAGANDFLSKPIDQAELTIRVANLLKVKACNNFLRDHNKILEDEVRKRTCDLKKVYEENLQLTEELRQKLKELEGRDLIQQQLLTFHPLEETLQIVLEVINDIIQPDISAVYLGETCDRKAIKSLASPHAEGENLWKTAGRPLDDALGNVCNRHKPVMTVKRLPACFEKEEAELSLVAIPLIKGETCRGHIVAARWRKPTLFSEDEARVLENLAGLAAIAIRDAQLHDNLPQLEESIDSVLRNLEG